MKIARTQRGFTLVELLVVIGIIALLISILLPSLKKANDQAKLVKCLSNLRQLGIAINMYANDNKSYIIPSVIWKGDGSNTGDLWPTLLIAGKYLNDPNIRNDTSNQIKSKSILVCPSTRDIPIFTLISASNAGANDGFLRLTSTVVKPAAGTYPGLTIECGYGINSCAERRPGAGAGPNTAIVDRPEYTTLPSLSIAYGADQKNLPQLHRLMEFKNSTRVVLLYDGYGFNTVEYQNTPPAMSRIEGGRHGRTDPKKPYDTGIVNVLMLDFHVESAPRISLPTASTPVPNGAPNLSYQLAGDRKYNRDKNYVWSLSQQ